MSLIYLLLRVLPLWLLPVTYILVELAIRMKQKDRKLEAIFLGFIILVNLSLTVLWFIQSGWSSFPTYLKSIVESAGNY